MLSIRSSRHASSIHRLTWSSSTSPSGFNSARAPAANPEKIVGSSPSTKLNHPSNPCFAEFTADRAFPASFRGPVLCLAFSRFAAICFVVAIGFCLLGRRCRRRPLAPAECGSASKYAVLRRSPSAATLSSLCRRKNSPPRKPIRRGRRSEAPAVYYNWPAPQFPASYK